MDKQALINLINQTIDTKMDSMTNFSVPAHYHTGWDANQLDPAVALLGFPVIQVSNATVAPTDTPQNGTFRFYVDTTPRYRLWAYLTYQNTSSALIGSWKSIALT